MSRPPEFNPFAAPKSSQAGATARRGLDASALAGLTACGVLACGLLGALTNAVNGRVSPEYFVAVMGWHGVVDVASASIAQGIFEGTAFGMIYALLFVAGVARITGSSCSFGFALRHLAATLAGALLAWSIGGLAAVGLASLSPEWYRMMVRGEPEGGAALTRFAWVGGSIMGIEVGGFLALVAGLIGMRASWRRQVAREIRFVG